ncbi:MAG: 23S rRNA (adenine(2503)-C(2))-methyltransferase RlmN [Candidatus Hydrogenedentes bacterium]|nr:23S rRNA (adenine(2503)-C(2))-methyltransferase RlmN [Candidatus Hydrogenedentota bacterium]
MEVDTEKLALTGMLPEEISATLNLAPYQGKQIFRWLHAKKIFDFERMSDLPKAVRATLQEQCVAAQLELVEMQESPRTGTRKALLRLPDEETVESVLIRDRDRVTLCLSSQVGCPLKCDFCATGLAGYKRNLTPAEIVEQALYLLQSEPLDGRTPNIVFMGMGEPFRNYDAVIKSIHLLMAPEGLGIGARKITVSTAGDAKGIERFADEDWQVRLSVSMHAANNELRSKLVPLNRKYPIERLREAIDHYVGRTGRQITFEWTLLQDVNDSLQDAEELAAFMGGLKATVNLIPWNPVHGLPYSPPSRARCEAFRDALIKRGITATLRQEKGQDIDAACGQLRRIHGEHSSKTP